MKKQGWIIYREADAVKNQAFIRWFQEECQKQDLQLTFLLRESIQIGIENGELSVKIDHQPSTIPDFAVMRTIDFSLSRQLEQLGVSVFNSSEVATVCNNKTYTHQMISELKIPMVDSLFVSKDLLTENLPMPLPYVTKAVGGRSGNQVQMISSPEDWGAYRQQLVTDDIVIQSCDVQLGKDLRVFVVGNKIVGSVLRQSDQDFRANYSLGGSATWYNLSQKERDTVETIIARFDFGMVGVDFLFDHDGDLLFNEIEDVVGSRTLSMVSDVNIVEQYVAHIRQRLSD
ncbi:ATP-grasp domain-containing protein [Aquibacillus sediminis]|uniref:ATP-grasp domain-containing protein n=1 Tax=Aquibacillus sediminis TaxID=2574734 RepID=UPI001109977B|nr:hypothetical protein [Aquibacillus sediminis]